MDIIVRIARSAGILRPRDLDEHRIPRQYLRLAVEQGRLNRIARGLYIDPSTKSTMHHTLATAARRVPKGVICLLSALRFHGLTTQAPHEVWLAIDRKARKPRMDHPPLRIVRFSGRSLMYGVLVRSVDGVQIHVFNAAKTVADCFKYRNKIGLDVVLEALRDCRRKRKATAAELWEASKVCRVSRVMQPYLESLN